MSDTPMTDARDAFIERAEIDRQATERVLRARVELITARKFYGVLVMNVEPVLSRAFPTMATDGSRHYFNPDFVKSLSQVELLAVQAHESEHDARHHGTRREGRDPMKWNIACDYAINVDLIDQGFVLPKGALIDDKYRGMSAEDIYRSRELDEQQKQKQKPAQDEEQQQQQDDENGEGESEGDDDQSTGDQPDDRTDDRGEPDEDQPDPDGEKGHPKQGNEQGETDDKGGTGQGGEQQESVEDKQTLSDPGRCGEVLDSAKEVTEIAEQDIKWERIVREAATQAELAGELPGHIAREITRANNPTRDWRDELREFCEDGALRIETWNRPNRRHIGRGQILPSAQRDGVGKAAFIIDTSGSMDVPSLRAVLDEAQAMLDDGVIEEAVIISCDTRVTDVQQYTTGEEITFEAKGGGGTNLRPAFEYVASEHSDTALIVCFTDLMIGDPGPQPFFPVLFAVTGYPATVKEMIAKAPWGARAIDVGAR